MSSKKFDKKLVLNKKTIAHLGHLDLDKVKGGVYYTYSCPTECDDSCLMGGGWPFPEPYILCKTRMAPGPA